MKANAISHPLPVPSPGTRHPGGTMARFPTTRSDVLFGQQRELLIEHAGSIYRLRITQNNKLILTK